MNPTSESLGFSYTMDGQEVGFGVTASASRNRGQSQGNGVNYTQTVIQGGRVEWGSGGDTTLDGAVIQGQQVSGKVGGNLSVTSVQDMSTYQSSSSRGGSVTAGAGTFGGSVSAGQSKVNSNYRSVSNVSGIQAGDGGFQIEVAGNTTLHGGVIASTQAAVEAGRNQFATANLTVSDLQNTASYSARGSGVTLGVGPGSGNSAGVGQASGSAGSVTTAGISGMAGNTQVRTGDGAGGIEPIFDAERVQADIDAQVSITASFGQRASKAIGAYAGRRYEDLRLQAILETDPAKRAALEEEAVGRGWGIPDGAARGGGGIDGRDEWGSRGDGHLGGGAGAECVAGTSQ